MIQVTEDALHGWRLRWLDLDDAGPVGFRTLLSWVFGSLGSVGMMDYNSAWEACVLRGSIWKRNISRVIQKLQGFFWPLFGSHAVLMTLASTYYKDKLKSAQTQGRGGELDLTSWSGSYKLTLQKKGKEGDIIEVIFICSPLKYHCLVEATLLTSFIYSTMWLSRTYQCSNFNFLSWIL